MSQEEYNNLKDLIGSAKNELIKADQILTALNKTTDMGCIQSGLDSVKKFIANADEILQWVNRSFSN